MELWERLLGKLDQSPDRQFGSIAQLEHTP